MMMMMTSLNAFANMGFILLLMGIMAFMFGIFAINLFESYTHSNRPGLLYQEKFSDLPQALITLFQLFTLDQWYSIEADVRLVVNPAVSIVFFVTWVWIGAFIFRNIFVGVMGRRWCVDDRHGDADGAMRQFGTSRRSVTRWCGPTTPYESRRTSNRSSIRSMRC